MQSRALPSRNRAPRKSRRSGLKDEHSSSKNVRTAPPSGLQSARTFGVRCHRTLRGVKISPNATENRAYHWRVQYQYRPGTSQMSLRSLIRKASVTTRGIRRRFDNRIPQNQAVSAASPLTARSVDATETMNMMEPTRKTIGEIV